jgi:hypothetical protein
VKLCPRELLEKIEAVLAVALIVFLGLLGVSLAKGKYKALWVIPLFVVLDFMISTQREPGDPRPVLPVVVCLVILLFSAFGAPKVSSPWARWRPQDVNAPEGENEASK